MATPRGLLGERAHQTLKDAILTRALPPGTPLVELELVRRFGIGRTPIREALRRLREEGLVRIVGNRGASVEHVGYTDIEDALYLRGMIELATRLGAPLIRVTAGQAHPAVPRAQGVRWVCEGVAALKCRMLGGRAGIPSLAEARAFLRSTGPDLPPVPGAGGRQEA